MCKRRTITTKTYSTCKAHISAVLSEKGPSRKAVVL